MSGDHVSAQNERALWLAFVPTAAFMVIEIAAGLMTGSLALISDATHMATDVAGIMIALAALRVGRRPPDARRTFGYARFEMLAAALNAALLIGVAVYILIEAYRRLRSPQEISSTAMLWVAVAGLCVNAFSMWMLAAGKDHSINMKGAYLEVWSDFLGSVGVIIAALLVRLTGWTIVDSIVAVAIGLWVLPRSWMLLRETVNVLLEGVPRSIDLGAVRDAMLAVAGVANVHDLHVWALSSERICLTAHVVAPAENHEEIVAKLNGVLRERFAISHVTIQPETRPCADAALGEL